MITENATWWNMSIEPQLNVSFIIWTDSEKEESNFTSTENYSVPEGIQALMYVMYTTISLAAVGGNGIVCYIVLADRRMRTVTNYFIVNLAVGDLLMAILCIPFTFVVNLILHRWPFGTTLCVVVTYAQAVSVFISAYTMIAISVDKYIAIIKPLRPRMTKLQAKLLIFLVWAVAIITPLPTAIVSRLVAAKSSDGYHCTEVWDPPEQRYYYGMSLMTLQYFLPLMVLIFTYTRIAMVVWGKRTPGEAEDGRDQRLAASKRKMVKMMITVVTVFTLCWLPLNTLIVVGDQDQSIWYHEHIEYVWFVCHWLAMSHASYNPIIYCWMNSKFRNGFWQIFCLLLPCIRGSRPVHFRERKNIRSRTCTSERTTSFMTSVTFTTVSNVGQSLSTKKGSTLPARTKFRRRISKFEDETSIHCNFE
ncbi:RYamide receptor-like [Limulus polyphemus]|uniref:RYamide receptor-like n=1 Tax=Limulus polyphemus TaxID=6850 RepID=A0ABM1B524_LIMPO|nr:RYamide receptor-like [Limulus polyphemus]